MIYTRMIDENRLIDCQGNHKELRNEIASIVTIFFNQKKFSEDDISILILSILDLIKDDEKKLAMISIIIDDIKGGKVWQELEALSKSVKK